MTPHGAVDAQLDELESESIFIIREAFGRLKPLAMLWSMGKDSTALLWLVRKAFFGRVPFPLYLLDTGMELPEVYAFRDALVGQWSLNVHSEPCPPEGDVDATLPTRARAAARKTAGLKQIIRRERLKGVLVGIRRDEQGVRAKERVFSPRDASGGWDYGHQPAELWNHYQTRVPADGHVRVHPLLSWTEIDVWRYTRREGIPFVGAYLSRGGHRYRSLGESNLTVPVASAAASIDEVIDELELTTTPERAGRTMDDETEDSFERLRLDGYM